MNKHIVFFLLSALAISGFGISHKDFGRLVEGDNTKIQYAPSWLVVNGITTGEALLTTNDYWSAAWKSLSDVRPTTDEKHYAVATGWANRDEHWIDRVYEIREVPPTPARRIYKYDLSVACMEYGEITNLVTFISADIGTKWMWDAAEIVVEDDKYFIAATNEVISSGLVSEQKVKAILDRAYELGQNTEATK